MAMTNGGPLRAPEPPSTNTLTISGTWTNPQYVGQAPDITGLTFHYSGWNNDGGYTNADIPSSEITIISPATWQSAGTQTITFEYSYGVGTRKTYTAEVLVPEFADKLIINAELYEEIS